MFLPFKTLTSALLLAAAPLGAVAQQMPTELPRIIQVVGEGRVTAAPDMARISLGVSHQAATAGEAMAAMSEGTSAVLSTLAEGGVQQTDIQTGQLMLEPAFNYNTPDGNPVMIGFIATQMLDVNVRDLARLGEVLDAVVRGGANRVNGVTFDVADPQGVQDDVRRDALDDARLRAELYAEASGVALGDLVSVSESTVYAPPIPLYDAHGAAGHAMNVPIAPGAVTLMTSVTVTYEIAE